MGRIRTDLVVVSRSWFIFFRGGGLYMRKYVMPFTFFVIFYSRPYITCLQLWVSWFFKVKVPNLSLIQHFSSIQGNLLCSFSFSLSGLYFYICFKLFQHFIYDSYPYFRGIKFSETLFHMWGDFPFI